MKNFNGIHNKGGRICSYSNNLGKSQYYINSKRLICKASNKKEIWSRQKDLNKSKRRLWKR